jgi:hypothetical protein
MERATYEEVAFRYLAADEHPDHDTIADFRKEHLTALGQLFVQVLRLCQQAGRVKLGHVALDGTKVKANASQHKAMSYERMGEAEKKLEAEVRALLEEAAAGGDRSVGGAGSAEAWRAGARGHRPTCRKPAGLISDTFPCSGHAPQTPNPARTGHL